MGAFCLVREPRDVILAGTQRLRQPTLFAVSVEIVSYSSASLSGATPAGCWSSGSFPNFSLYFHKLIGRRLDFRNLFRQSRFIMPLRFVPWTCL